MGRSGCDVRVDPGIGKERIHGGLAAVAHRMGPCLLRGQIGDGGIPAQEPLPRTVGQIDGFQDEGTGGEGGIFHPDGDFPDPRLADEPVHGNGAGAAVRIFRNPETFPSGHQKSGQPVVPKVEDGLFEFLEGPDRFGTEGVLRAVDDRPGRVTSPFQFPGDGAGRCRDTVIRQFSVPKQQERPVKGRLFVGRVRCRNTGHSGRGFDGKGYFHRGWPHFFITCGNA